MVFSSMTFMAFFLPAVILLYFSSKNPAWRNGVLVAFSLLFYAWGEPKRVLMMLFSILVNYGAALLIDRAKTKAARRFWLVAGLSVTLGFLVYYKYFAFFVNSVGALFGNGALVAARSLPIGISFFTFQIITYTVDVFLGKTPVQKSLARLTLYISFFPQLIAGPIVNYTYIAPQLAERKTSVDDAYAGLSRFAAGLGKKVLLANVCGEILAELELAGDLSLLAAWLGAVAFTFQIYFDFSGYSDMAIGLGRIFGFKFLENFNYPYISTSVTEFWRRWHISLGAFFREYVYIPLGGNRVSRSRQVLNLAAVWALTGLWHGASWNFIAWGVYYGALLILEKQLLQNLLAKVPVALRWLGTMVLVVFGWVLFYHESLAAGLHQMAAMVGLGTGGLWDAASLYYLKRYLGVLLLAAAASVPWKEWLPALLCKVSERRAAKAADGAVRMNAGGMGHALETAVQYALPVLATAVIGLSIAFVVSGSYNPFLYFRF